jgi:predicted transcriptional regulator
MTWSIPWDDRRAFTHMTPKLTSEQRESLQHCDGPVPVEDDENRRLYFLIDASTLDGLQRNQDIEAIREGIADMDAGRVERLDEAIARIRANLGLEQPRAAIA